MRTTETDKQNVADAIDTILNALNGGNQKDLAEVVFGRLRQEHRTLQQGFWSMMLQAQIKYADMPSDARNEAAVRLANYVKSVAEANNMDMGLPRI